MIPLTSYADRWVLSGNFQETNFGDSMGTPSGGSVVGIMARIPQNHFLTFFLSYNDLM